MCNDFNEFPDDTVGSYESYCNDYALFGDPERDHYDYEENARYDRYDGWGDCGDNPLYDDCPVCGDRGDCAECLAWKDRAAELYRDACEARDDCADSDVPF